MNSGDHIVYMPVDLRSKDPKLNIGDSYLLLSMFPDKNGSMIFNIDIPVQGVGVLGYYIDGINFLSQEEYRIHKINEIIKD